MHGAANYMNAINFGKDVCCNTESVQFFLVFIASIFCSYTLLRVSIQVLCFIHYIIFSTNNIFEHTVC
jgi:hypothetical protein